MLRGLSRVTTSGRYIPEIDGLRFLAIMPVVLVHVRNFLLVKNEISPVAVAETDWLAHLTAHGHYGVQLFFVISGFVLALPFAAHALQAAPPVRLKSYYLRRLTRLEPPYVLCLLICFGLFIVIGKASAVELLPHLATGLTYSHSLVYGTHNPLNLVTWSLEVEIQFYLLVPALALLFNIRRKAYRRAWLVFICVVAVTMQGFLMPAESRLSLSILNFLQYFLMGFLLADVYLCDWNEAPVYHRRWDVVSFAGWPLLLLLFEWPRATAIVLPFLLFWLYYAGFRGVYFRYLLTRPLLTVTGGMCYTIYLIHFQVISFVGRLFPPVRVSSRFFINYLFLLPAFLVIIGSASVVYFVCVEKPCMRRDWPQRLREKLQSWMMPKTEIEKPVASPVE